LILQQRAYGFGHQMTWPSVARAYAQAYEDLCDGNRAIVRDQATAELDLAPIQIAAS
jgi:hypothetical protein